MSSAPAYPVIVDGELQPSLSRWLWLVKLVLVIPHAICLVFLWIAFTVLTAVAFASVLFRGRYPRSLYGFNVGVLRWTWRVAFYAFAAFGTDRYPPFTLADVPDYPARLHIAYPEHLPRGLRLIGRWLLGIPHYLVAAAFAGGGWFALQQGDARFPETGIAGALAVIAALVLLFTGRYPRGLFDFVVGLDRWVIRAAAYAALLTDEYPPFRIDLGEHELVAGAAPGALPAPTAVDQTSARGARGPGIVLGALGILLGLGLVGAGAVGAWADRTQRDRAGYLMTAARPLGTRAYALTSKSMRIDWHGPSWLYPSEVLGTVRIRATSQAPGGSVFVGIARTRAASAYLAGVGHAVVRDVSLDPFRVHYLRVPGGAPAAAPASERFWAASAVGSGSRTVTWDVRRGSWSIVVMNADGSRGVAAAVSIGATAPALGWIAVVLLASGALVLVGSVLLLVYAATARRSRRL